MTLVQDQDLTVIRARTVARPTAKRKRPMVVASIGLVQEKPRAPVRPRAIAARSNTQMRRPPASQRTSPKPAWPLSLRPTTSGPTTARQPAKVVPAARSSRGGQETRPRSTKAQRPYASAEAIKAAFVAGEPDHPPPFAPPVPPPPFAPLLPEDRATPGSSSIPPKRSRRHP